MNILDLPILIINLSSRPDRWNNMFSQLSTPGFRNIYRIDAIVGKDLNLSQVNITPFTRYLLDYPENRCNHYQLHKVGAIGCSLSHLKCMNYILENRYTECIIFEDDCFFDKNFIPNLSNEIDICKKNNFDFLAFGYNAEFGPKTINDYKTVNNYFGTHAYYLNNKAAETIKQYFFPLEVHVDGYYSLLLQQKLLNGMLSKKSICNTDDFGSDIEHGNCIKCYINNNTTITYMQMNSTVRMFKILLLLIILIFVKIFFRFKK